MKYHMLHGHGYKVFSNGDRYFGEWSDNKAHGQGKRKWASGHFYTGSWVENETVG